MTSPTFQINDRRFKDLILYVSARLQDDPTFGETKLNKILFFSDFESFRLRGTPITGAEYQRNHHGPTARIYTILRNQMVNREEIELKKVMVGGYPQTTVTPRIDPQTQFDDAEREIVDVVIDKLRRYTNKEASDQSHEYVAGWRALPQGRTIPYSAAIVDPTPLSEDERTQLRELVGV